MDELTAMMVEKSFDTIKRVHRATDADAVIAAELRADVQKMQDRLARLRFTDPIIRSPRPE
jgi:hypothetical protein